MLTAPIAIPAQPNTFPARSTHFNPVATFDRKLLCAAASEVSTIVDTSVVVDVNPSALVTPTLPSGATTGDSSTVTPGAALAPATSVVVPFGSWAIVSPDASAQVATVIVGPHFPVAAVTQVGAAIQHLERTTARVPWKVVASCRIGPGTAIDALSSIIAPGPSAETVESIPAAALAAICCWSSIAPTSEAILLSVACSCAGVGRSVVASTAGLVDV